MILSFCDNQPNILFQLCSYFFLHLKVIHISFQNGNDRNYNLHASTCNNCINNSHKQFSSIIRNIYAKISKIKEILWRHKYKRYILIYLNPDDIEFNIKKIEIKKKGKARLNKNRTINFAFVCK